MRRRPNAGFAALARLKPDEALDQLLYTVEG